MIQSQHVPSESLSAYLDGELPAGEQAAISAHLESCTPCRRELEELRTTVQLLNGLPQFNPRRSFQLRSMHRRPVVRPTPIVRLLPIVRAMSVAAILVFMIAGSARLLDVANNNNSGPTTSERVFPVSSDETTDGVQASDEEGNADGRSGSMTERGNAASNDDESLAVIETPTPESDTVAQADRGADSANPAGTASDDGGRSGLATIALGAGLLALALTGLWLVLIRLVKPVPGTVRRN